MRSPVTMRSTVTERWCIFRFRPIDDAILAEEVEKPFTEALQPAMDGVGQGALGQIYPSGATVENVVQPALDQLEETTKVTPSQYEKATKPAPDPYQEEEPVTSALDQQREEVTVVDLGEDDAESVKPAPDQYEDEEASAREMIEHQESIMIQCKAIRDQVAMDHAMAVDMCQAMRARWLADKKDRKRKWPEWKSPMTLRTRPADGQ